ncbi:MAG: hypothetical protein QF489_04340 [Planctomycetota bacterium]|jgi:DNA-binding transcriptional regulator YiaG|nr:hypothetical protein [Planctomycetota bacterium]
MANIATLLKAEIKRHTDKAVREALRPLAKQLRVEKKRVQDLERKITKLSNNVAKGSTTAASKGFSKTSTWSHVTVTNLRKRHQLSQNALAKLLGVGINTVWLWEQGRTKPRAKQQDGIRVLEGLSDLQMRRRLTKVGLKAGRSKPGRKPGSKNKKSVATKKVTKKTKKKVVKRR